MKLPVLLSRLALVAGMVVTALPVAGQETPLVCQVASAALQVRAEGRAERVGDITITCQGGTPGQVGRTNLVLFLNRPITNTVSNDTLRDVTVAVDQGLGLRASAVRAVLQGATSLTFNGLDFTVPASRAVQFRVSGVRVDVSGQNQQVLATLSFSGTNALTLNQAAVPVALPVTGLYVTGALGQIVCVLSRFPESMTFAGAMAEPTYFFTARATEGFETSFTAREPGADQGTRIVVRYSGFPAEARLAVLDLVVGSTGPVPTSAGDFGQAISAGQYATGALLLARVVNTDANGAGGVVVTQLGQPALGALREVAMSNGSGIAVYEVMDGNAFTRESAQIPTFLDLRRTTTEGTPFASAKVNLGPLAGSTAVPRFADVTPASDCGVVRDCNASYFPQLFVDPQTAVTVTAAADAGAQVQYVRVLNEGGGLLAWTARVEYEGGGSTGWLTLDRTNGFNNATIRMDFLASRTAGAGTYRANVVIDGGSQGSKTVPVTFTVTPRAVPVGPAVTSVVHAATYEEFLVPGGLAMLRGARLGGDGASVKVGGLAARVVYAGAEQINFEVPVALVGRESADVVVTAGGVDSAARMVRLRPVLPGIFPGGVLNEQGTGEPVKIGGLVRVLFTGVPAAGLETVRVTVHDWEGLTPVTAAMVPGVNGVSYADVVVPVGMPAMTSNLVVCASASLQAGSPGVCSLPAKISMVE